MKRYERNLGTIGENGQKELANTSVLIVGLGGLGGYVLEALVRLGIGKVIGVDKDVFDETNLNRQILALDSNIGQNKVEVAAQRALSINPLVTFEGFNCDFEQLDNKIFQSCSIVFDCIDTLSGKKNLAKLCQKNNVTLVHGAVAGWCGQVGVINITNSTFDDICSKREKGIEKKLGNLSFTVGFTANLMVARALPILLKEKLSTNFLTFFDLKNNDFENIIL